MLHCKQQAHLTNERENLLFGIFYLSVRTWIFRKCACVFQKRVPSHFCRRAAQKLNGTIGADAMCQNGLL